MTNQNQKEIVGTVFGVGKAFENDTKAVAIHAEIENKNEELISGMYVNALIDLLLFEHEIDELLLKELDEMISSYKEGN